MLITFLKECKCKFRRFLQRQFGTHLLQEQFNSLHGAIQEQKKQYTQLQERVEAGIGALERQAQVRLELECQAQERQTLERQAQQRQALEQHATLQAKFDALDDSLAQQAVALHTVSESRLSAAQFQATITQAGGLFDGLRHVTECFEDLHKFKFTEWIGILRHLRKTEYLESITRGKLPVPKLNTEFPVASHSNDTLHPRGAKNDNSIVPRFNQRIYELLGSDRQLSVLDLGCAGGGFVRSLIDDGHVAVGLEGSDYPRLMQKDEWSTIPQHLHTCDIVKPFELVEPETNQPWQFDAITAWELMEHITEQDLPALLANIRKHLKPNGFVFLSIATFEDAVGDVVYHHTVRPKHWWKTLLTSAHFDIASSVELCKNDWVRGSGHCYGDWHEDEDMGFHIVLQPKGIALEQPLSVRTSGKLGAVA